MTAAARMPSVFIGHDSPMNTLQVNDFTRAWRALGQALPRPDGLHQHDQLPAGHAATRAVPLW